MDVGLSPMGKFHLLLQALDDVVGQDDELLVGGRLEPELITLFLEHPTHLHSLVNAVARQLEVEIIRKQCVELQSDKSSLGNDGAVLLLDGEEMLVGLTVGEHHRLATQGADLRAADVEHVAMARQEGQCNVAALGHQAIAQTRTVDIKRDVVVLADGIELRQFLRRIERAQLGGEGDVHQAGEHGMGIVAVVHEVVEVFVEHTGTHLALLLGQRDDFMLRKLHGTRLMDVDMTTADADDALVLIEHGVDGGSIGLRAAREEENLGVGHSASLADTSLSPLAICIEAIGSGFAVVVLHQVLQYQGVSPVVVVAFKGNHVFHFLLHVSAAKIRN